MPERRRQPSHDAAWKQFFALSVVVEHLLRGFFPEVAALLDFPTLRDVSGEWVQDGTRRRGDSVWRVRYRDGTDRSLMVFLEFQSAVDADMARRVLRNVGMAYERVRRNGALDGDDRLRPLCVVVHAGSRPWTAPGAAARVEVSGTGEVRSPMSQPYAALDARRHAREHLPTRNLVSTLFGLNRVRAVDDVVAPLAELGGWLPGSGIRAGPVRAAYAEWPATTMPTLFPGTSAGELVGRLTRTGIEEEAMAVTVLEERLRRQLRRVRRDGEAVGMERGVELGVARALAGLRDLLHGQTTRKFGADTGTRVAGLLAGIGDMGELQRVGDWIMDCETGAELIARFGNGAARD